MISKPIARRADMIIALKAINVLKARRAGIIIAKANEIETKSPKGWNYYSKSQ